MDSNARVTTNPAVRFSKPCVLAVGTGMPACFSKSVAREVGVA
jgi:hypothetical protein